MTIARLSSRPPCQLKIKANDATVRCCRGIAAAAGSDWHVLYAVDVLPVCKLKTDRSWERIDAGGALLGGDLSIIGSCVRKDGGRDA
jgi:hypothetical protein